MTYRLGLAYFLLAAGQYGYIAFLLLKFWSAKRSFSSKALIGSLPPVSVLIPVKGVLSSFEENFRSFLNQDYLSDGAIEIVLGVKDPSDPVIAEAKRIMASASSKATLKFAVGGADQGLNPKNSNLVRAYGQATHEWIYCSDADVRLSQDHLRRCLISTAGDPMRYATTLTVNEGPQTLGARLECIGANFEATMYFMSIWVKKVNDSMNGASMFFNRKLLEKAGGFSVSLNKLTDDLVLGREFTLHGGQGSLVLGVVRERLVRQTFKAFYDRLIRWIMIASSFRPELFWIAPIFWVWQWFVLIGLITMSPTLLAFGAATFLVRALTSALTQIVLGAPASDLLSIWVLVIYDLCAPVAWFQSLFQRKIVWAGNPLIVSKNGLLVKE